MNFSFCHVMRADVAKTEIYPDPTDSRYRSGHERCNTCPSRPSNSSAGRDARAAQSGRRRRRPVRGFAADDRRGQHVHRAGRMACRSEGADDPPHAAGGRFPHRADRPQGERCRQRREGGLGDLPSGCEVAAQGDQRFPRQGWMDESSRLHLPDLAQREARRRRQHDARERHVDRHHLRHGAGRGREARRAGGADLRTALSEGLRARDVCRKDGQETGRQRDRRALGIHRERTPEARRAGRRARPGAGRQGRLRRRLRRPRARRHDEARRRHALHDRVEHEGADHADAREAGGRGQDDVGYAGHDAAAVVQAGRCRHDEPGAGQAPDLRVHRPAAPGLRVAVPVQGRDARRMR